MHDIFRAVDWRRLHKKYIKDSDNEKFDAGHSVPSLIDRDLRWKTETEANRGGSRDALLVGFGVGTNAIAGDGVTAVRTHLEKKMTNYKNECARFKKTKKKTG